MGISIPRWALWTQSWTLIRHFLSSFSFSLLKSKSLVRDKLFPCQVLESMGLIFLKKCAMHNDNWDSEEAKGLLFWSPDHNFKEFEDSWKLSKFVFSAKWLKPIRIFVSSFNHSKFWVEEILFGSVLINFSITFLNMSYEMNFEY